TLTLSLAPEIRAKKINLISYIFNYNAGRITSYALAGSIAGAIDLFVIISMGPVNGYRLLQILSAVIMTASGLYIAGWFPRYAYIEKAGLRFWKLIEPYGRRLIPVRNRVHAFLFGMIWGWLPCGLVYAALALAATAGNITNSALTMFFFGLGTLPAVMSVGIMSGLLTRLSRLRFFKQAAGLFMIVLALFAALPWLNPMAYTAHNAFH
ncbi:MAG TPA: sulfite exporter TauE/SafE family protein, partial [Methylomicrobium sp.]|nr:sulfite exporter TauE/SafE family protein [Methylomicrobium sp.]